MAQLAGLNHLLRLDESPSQPKDHHLAGTKPLFINPLRHPMRISQVAALAMVQLVETLSTWNGDWVGLVMPLLFFLLFLSVCVFPVPSSVLLSLFFTVTCMCVPLHGSGELLCMAYALGMLVYDTSLRFGFLIATPVGVGIVVQSVRFPDTNWNLALNSAPVLIFLMIVILYFGQSSRSRSKLMEAHRQSEQAKELTRRVRAARMIHDSVAGDLANIARVSQRQVRRCDDPDEREAWRQVNEQSVRVLDGVHAVIRQLSGDGAVEQADDKPAQPTGFLETVRTRVRRWQTRMAEAGMHGDARIIDHSHMPMPFTSGDAAARRSCVLAMIDETFTNILRHGRRGDDAYNLVITLDKRHLEIVAMNPLPDTDDMGDGLDGILDLPGGNGLRLHREEVENLGGVMSVGDEDSMWVLYLRMPYAAAQPAGARPRRYRG